MTDPHSEMHQGFEEILRTMLMAAAKIRERVAERRTQQQQQRQQQADRTERQSDRVQTSQRAMLNAEFSPVHQRQWWNHARPERIARLWELSNRFSPEHDGAQSARDTMRATMQQRYGIDPETIQHDGRGLTTAVAAITADEKTTARSDELRDQADQQRSARGQDHDQGHADLADAHTARDEHQPDQASHDRDQASHDFTHAAAHHTEATRLTEAAAQADTNGLAATHVGSQPQTASHSRGPAGSRPEGGYQRARTSDMPNLDAATAHARVKTAEAFPHPTGQLGQQARNSGTKQRTGRTPQQQHRSRTRSR